MKNTLSVIEQCWADPLPKETSGDGKSEKMGLVQYIAEMKKIATYEYENEQLKKEVKLLEKEIEKTKHSKLPEVAINETRRDILQPINVEESTIQMCIKCKVVNKKYPEIFNHRFCCICIGTKEQNADNNFERQTSTVDKLRDKINEKKFSRRANCICRVGKKRDKFILK